MNGKDQEWMVKNWMPRANATQLKYSAFLVPEAALAKRAYEETTPQIDSKITAASFDTIEAAREWLGSL